MTAHDSVEDAVEAIIGWSVPVFAVATILLWLVAPLGTSRLRLAATSGLAAAGLALLVNQVISHLWSRPRPYAAHSAITVIADRSTDPSFPSDHAAAAFAIAFAIAAFSATVGTLFLSGATIIALSRVAGGLHYPSDVVAGFLVGLLAAAVVVTLGREPVERVVALLARVADPILGPVRRPIEAAIRRRRRQRA